MGNSVIDGRVFFFMSNLLLVYNLLSKGPIAMSQKTVFIFGAGSTYAESFGDAPMDRGFFKLSEKLNGNDKDFIKVQDYMQDKYNIDITAVQDDSIERILGILYSDAYHVNVKDDALEAFRSLVKLFNRVLAKATNEITPSTDGYVYRLIKKQLDQGISPEDITVITFNYDINIERTLDFMNNVYRDDVFSFPSCYMLNISADDVTSPSSGKKENLCFKTTDSKFGITLLKMHGSLNWYSRHKSKNVPLSSIMDPDRSIYLTSRKRIYLDMRYVGKRKQYIFPIMVPPVVHKAGVLHNDLKMIWKYAEETLTSANNIIIFGYSCPQADTESANLIRRTIKLNSELERVSIIDPNPAVMERYIDLMKICSIRYYTEAEAYINDKIRVSSQNDEVGLSTAS